MSYCGVAGGKRMFMLQLELELLETAVARKSNSPTILRYEVFQGKSLNEVGRSRKKNE